MKQLKVLRKERGLSQAGLAELSDVDQSYISKIERGTKNPTVVVLRTLAKSLNVPVTRLLEDEPEERAA